MQRKRDNGRLNMRINEIFYTLQGEGYFTGVPSVFLRFSGCNLKCPFCDTLHNKFIEMTEDEIVTEMDKYPSEYVVITGGEPTLQITSSLVEKLHAANKKIQIETNGTSMLPSDCDVDWITCSPKFEFCENAKIKIQRIDELKVVYTAENKMSLYSGVDAKVYSLQPCDMGEVSRNKKILAASIRYCSEHPKWRLSLQTQKILNIR